MYFKFLWETQKFLKRKNYILEENYHLLSELYRKNERLYHDMNHHLQMIYHLAKRLDCPEIQDYVTSIHTPIMELSDMVWSGNDIVDAILNHTQHEARKLGIKMDINAEYPKDCPISSDDICVILFNLLDNAIEACLKTMNVSLPEKSVKTTITNTPIEVFTNSTNRLCSKAAITPSSPDITDSPIIFVTIRRIHDFLIIKVQNPYAKVPKKRFGLFASSKSNSLHHGIGLKNVKEIVEKYQGNLEFDIKNERFTTTTLLFLDKKT